MVWEWNENQQDLKSLNYVTISKAAKASWRSDFQAAEKIGIWKIIENMLCKLFP